MARKHTIAPLTVEDAHTPGHEGMLSFLDITPEQARSKSASIKNDRGSIDDRGALGDRPSLIRLPTRPTEIDDEPRRAKRLIKVQACNRVQDGHSAIEQAVYNALWTRGKPEAEGSDTRIVHVGHAELMRLTSLVRNALKANLRSLAEKQAIEMLNGYNPADNRPSSYRVRAYKDILNRRKAMGMVYVVRGRSVRFCDQQGGELAPFIPTLAAAEQPAPVATQQPIDEALQLAEMLSGVVDMDAAARRDLIAACRAESASVRIEEIARLVTETAGKSRGNARNPVGFLLTVVPRQFESRGLEHSRSRWAAEDQASAREAADSARKAVETAAYMEREVKRMREIIADPGASASDRADAEKTLRQIGR